MNKKENKISKEIKINKKSARRNYSNQTGITLIALVVIIVVLLILTGVGISVLFRNSEIIEEDKNGINELNNYSDNKINETTGRETMGGSTTDGDEENSTTPRISTLVGKVVDKNTKAKDAYGNKITIPKGFKILAHSENTTTGDVTYTYSGDKIPAVQDGIVIENGTDGNQFVWVPVGEIKNKDNTKNTITLGRYSDFTMTNGTYTPVQSAADYILTTLEKIKTGDSTATIYKIGYYYYELNNQFEGNATKDSTAQNATARDLKAFVKTSLANGGYYIARFEASKNTTTNKVESKYDQTVLTNITQINAATVARTMYGDTIDYASDLVNSYAWDTAIIFIQTYSTGEDASSYAIENNSTSFANTGKNNGKYCNIWDMSGNAYEWTTGYSDCSLFDFYPCVYRGGCYNVNRGGADDVTDDYGITRTDDSSNRIGLRSLLYVK